MTRPPGRRGGGGRSPGRTGGRVRGGGGGGSSGGGKKPWWDCLFAIPAATPAVFGALVRMALVEWQIRGAKP